MFNVEAQTRLISINCASFRKLREHENLHVSHRNIAKKLTMEESLKTMLHCDDKEKLKERLAILQREYNRTVQRLKRAERSEAVRNHVRSRLAEQNLRQEGHDPGGPSDPCEAKGRRQCSVNQSVPEDQNRSPSVRFSLPHDVFGPCASPGVTAGSSASSRLSDTPQARSPGRHGESPAPAQGERRRSVHRLRSRRSRLRWERRERADSGVSDTENSEDGRDPAGDGERVRSGSTQIHFGTGSSEAICSGVAVGGADTEHAQHQGSQTVPASAHRAEDGDGRVACDAPLSDIRTAPVLEPLESSGTAATPSPSLLDTAGTPPRPVSEASVLEPEAPAEESPQSSVARPTLGPDTPEAGGLGSCTLIEGLLFPVEYYVRTTRRMSAAQSSVDLGAVIQSQLSGGRAGRGRGRRGRASSAASRSPAPGSRTAACKDTDSVGHVTPESESSLTPWSSPAASGTEPPRPVRGGRRRGRRSGRGQGRRRDHAPPVASPLGIDPPTPEYLRTDAVLTPDTDAHCRPAEKEMYPIFCTKSQQMESSSPKISPFPFNKESSQSSEKERLRGGVKCETLLLRSSPAPQRPHVFTPGGSHPSLRFLLSHFDAEDFHLPDDQFGTLKRLKLLSAAGDLESFVPHRSPYATRQRALGTPYGGAYRRRPRAARGLPPTDGPLSAQPDGKPAGRASCTSDQTDLGSDRDAPESLTPSLTPREVTRKEGCDSLPLGRADEAERIAGRCAAQEEGLGAGQEEGSAVRGADVAAGPSSPCVPNLSLTPTAPQTQKSTALALPSWGSPAFPSLGVTPAVPLQSSPPTQDCTPPTPTKAQSPHSQPTPQCTALPTPSQGPVISCELSAHTPSLSRTSSAGGHTQSHNAPCAAQDEAEPREAEALADGDQSAARAPSPDATELLVTDSLSSLSRCGSAFPLSCNPALSPAVEHGCNSSSPCPPDPGAPSPKPPESPCVPPLPPPPEGEGAVIDGADVSSSAEATPSTCLTDRRGEPVQQSQTAALGLSLPGAGRRGCADAGADADAGMGSMPMADMGEKNFTQGADPHKPAQDSLSAAQLSGCPAPPGPDTLPSSSLRSEQGDKDLDCYFTDSAWSRGVQTPPQSGHSAWGQSPAEKRLDTPPQSPLTVQDGPLSSSLKLTHTLKAPADRCLVDVCSVYGAVGWCVVTAEEWKVCVWKQSSSQQWSLLHTWTFTEHPVISLLSVPDSHSQLCVSLGKLEIREARILCCAGAAGQLSQSVLCTGEVQAVLGVSGARVACCATSASAQTVQVFTLTEDGRLEDSLSLVSPGQSVQALAAVDGQKDALIGSTDSSHLVLWNMRTGHLLQRFALGESLSGTVCLRGYSQSGVLFLLLQHQFLHHINLDEGAPFSLIATNPVTAKSVLVHQLTQPSQCVGRFTEGDVWESAVLGVFQSGSLAVWDLRDSDCVARLARGPEEGCHIARWGGPSTLLTGHLSGDVFLYQYTPLGLS
ncbi:partner and localizer of BRCA2 isoform X2 [Anguilla anguilla]|uniref:partner and localizer of BRCA2 isoform X2 n=1 Tax=Anguilla anguilla TaxID=7936 RepID=UPI0015AA6C03|nr:partner and localizer of BRCA2 isoform X2 [Anguilla anguilla]